MPRTLINFLLLAGLLTLGACAPVEATPTAPQSQEVAIFAYDPAQDQDAQGNILCSGAGLVALPRSLEAGLTEEGLLRAVVELQLAGGLTEDELGRGLTTEYPLNGVELLDTNLADGVATLTLADPQFQTSGGSCRVTILRAQLEAVALQISTVDAVLILPEELFQP